MTCWRRGCRRAAWCWTIRAPSSWTATPRLTNSGPTVASDGTNWVVVWMDQGADWKLDATRIAPDGTVLDPGGVPLYTAAFPNSPSNPRLTFAGDEYLLAWSGNNQIKGLRFARVAAHRQRLRSRWRRATSHGPPATAPTSSSHWQLGASVCGTASPTPGSVLDPGGIDVSGAHGGYPVTRGHLGRHAMDRHLGGRPQRQRLCRPHEHRRHAAATRRHARAPTRRGSRPSPGCRAAGRVLVWTDIRLGGLGRYDIFAATLTAGGTVGPAAGRGDWVRPRSCRPDLAGNGSGYLAVFVSDVSGETRIKAQRLDANGNALDAEPFLIVGGAATLTRPRVAWNGSHLSGGLGRQQRQPRLRPRRDLRQARSARRHGAGRHADRHHGRQHARCGRAGQHLPGGGHLRADQPYPLSR